MKKYLAYAFAVVILTAIGCNDGSIIGNDLLENEAIELDYDDNYLLASRTVRGDSVATFRRNGANSTYLLGEVNDPVFGKYASDIYTSFTYGSSLPNFAEATLDSIVLELEYDSTGFYGDDNVIHNIEVFRLEEDFVMRDTIYSDESFMSSMTPIGTKRTTLNFRDSINFQVRTEEVDSFINLSPRLNIRLDDAFGMELMADSISAQKDSALVINFKGLYIKSTTEGNSIASFNFLKSGSISEIISKVAVYYTQEVNGEFEKRTYNYLLRNEVYSNFEMDLTGSIVENSLNDYTAGEEFIYSQAMAGVNSEIDLPDLSALKGNIINSAQLVLTVSEDDALHFTETYGNSSAFLLSKPDSDGEGRVLIDDLSKSNVDINTALLVLDGRPRKVESATGDSIITVTFNITDFVKNSIESDNIQPKMILSPLGRSESPRRTVFYGSKHPTYPAKLRIAYTII